MRNKVNIFIGDDELDVFQDENIVINMSVQNIRDISKVFTDFTQGFSVPASSTNNQIFDHYYRTDIQGQDDWRLRATGRIEINGLLFRYGTIELEKVLLRGNTPYSYNIVFYGAVCNLTDLFGEDYLYDLESLSDYNLDYTPEVVHAGLASLFYYPVAFPLITAKDVWFYESNNSQNDPNNLYYHSNNQYHGLQYYDVKPAITINAIVEAVETKYGVTLNVTGIEDYEKLYMWCHRNAGYMYKDLPNAMPWVQITFASTGTPSVFDTSTGIWTVDDTYVYDYTIVIQNATVDYEVAVFLNGVLFQAFSISAHPSGTIARTFSALFNFGDEVSLYARAKNNVSLQLLVSGIGAIGDIGHSMSATNTALQTLPGQIDIPSLMPEQKVSDFLASLCKMFNLVIIPVSDVEFDIKPLNDWYATGTDKDLSKYFDITDYSVERPELYKQINFQYNETGAITGEQYRLTNDTGYGDLRTNFVFDTSEDLSVEPQFDQMLFTRLTDQDGGAVTNLLAGYALTRELETYLGQPFIFYINGQVSIVSNPIGFRDDTLTITGHRCVGMTQVNYANSSNQSFNAASTYSTNYGADIDPYLLQSVNNSLYNVYWSDYVGDLYDPSRRLVAVKAILPLGQMLNFDLANKLIWNGQKWIVNSVQLNLTTGQADFELLNDV